MTTPESPIRFMFGRIARRYNLLNRLMTLGQDRRWRREAARRLGPFAQGRLLDLGSGTGDLALQMLRSFPQARIVAADFTPQMLAIARRRDGAQNVDWLLADAQRLPFPSRAFDGVASAFLLRNVPDLDSALSEQCRVLKMGGRAVALDTTPPQSGWLSPFLRLYLAWIVPLLGKMLSADALAYQYLAFSTQKFLSAQDLAAKFRRAGFENVRFVRRMFGAVAIHWAESSDSSHKMEF